MVRSEIHFKGVEKLKKLIVIGAAGLLPLVLAVPAFAHVTVQPDEAPVGSFYKFNVRVPNERDNAATTKVEVQFPPLTNVSIQPKPGWNFKVKMAKLDEPIEVFGEEVDEAVGSVTWSGGRIEPGEFDEFGISLRTPDDGGVLEFAALQTYSNGEVVEWIGPADSDVPAARVNLVSLDLAEDQGELGLLAELQEQVDAGAANGGAADGDAADDSGADADDDTTAAAAEEDDDGSNLGVILGGIGIGLGVVAIGLALRRGRA